MLGIEANHIGRKNMDREIRCEPKSLFAVLPRVLSATPCGKTDPRTFTSVHIFTFSVAGGPERGRVMLRPPKFTPFRPHVSLASNE
jgi:hypothetical protein